MKKLIPILLISILLMGCSKPIECQNITINNTITEIKYIDRNITIPCNLTNTTVKYAYAGNTSRELELIRRLSYYEGQIDSLIINETECMPHNITEERLQNCEDKTDMYERDIEELEDELEDCEEEVCKWNSSWC